MQDMELESKDAGRRLQFGRSTGSNPIMKTIGIVVVIAFAAGAEGLPIAAITVT
jgi:hypothetical protein